MAAAPLSRGAVFPVGLVGVGNMGGAMAANLLERGWTAHVNDLDSEKIQNIESFGAVPSVNGSQLAMNCEAVIVCVVDAAQTDEVLFGPLGVAATLRPGRAVLLCPTMAPDDVERFAARLAERGLHAIDAPMSGGPARARDGSMSLMVACADAVFEAHRVLIEALSTKVFRISERPGAGGRLRAPRPRDPARKRHLPGGGSGTGCRLCRPVGPPCQRGVCASPRGGAGARGRCGDLQAAARRLSATAAWRFARISGSDP